MNFTRRNYINAAKNRRVKRELTRKLKHLGGPLHRPNGNNGSIRENNWSQSRRNEIRTQGLNFGNKLKKKGNSNSRLN